MIKKINNWQFLKMSIFEIEFFLFFKFLQLENLGIYENVEFLN